MLRFTGRDLAECLDYVTLFGLAPDAYSVSDLASDQEDGQGPVAMGLIGESLLPIG
ncbi:MAG: hypothetical protein VKN13_01565 [Cyanobacteriota bacterium]|nr:hypothetical protein [Cyanobacteriota bacterium]